MTWYPGSAGLDRWRDVYTAAARARGHEPDDGRRLRAWANAAGLTVGLCGTSTWTYATPRDAALWGDSQAERVEQSRFAEDARAAGVTTAEIAQAWREWGRHPDAFFVMVHGEVIATPPA